MARFQSKPDHPTSHCRAAAAENMRIICRYKSNICVDYYMSLCYKPAVSLVRGRAHETILSRSEIWRPAAAARNRGAREARNPLAGH
jgi:hypothetical protein